MFNYKGSKEKVGEVNYNTRIKQGSKEQGEGRRSELQHKNRTRK